MSRPWCRTGLGMLRRAVLGSGLSVLSAHRFPLRHAQLGFPTWAVAGLSLTPAQHSGAELTENIMIQIPSCCEPPTQAASHKLEAFSRVSSTTRVTPKRQTVGQHSFSAPIHPNLH
jgi:hypothetical protein